MLFRWEDEDEEEEDEEDEEEEDEEEEASAEFDPPRNAASPATQLHNLSTCKYTISDGKRCI